MLAVLFANPCMQEFSFGISEPLMLQVWKSSLPCLEFLSAGNCAEKDLVARREEHTHLSLKASPCQLAGGRCCVWLLFNKPC